MIHADKSTVNWYILRYSDVLLLYAEAVNETEGPTVEAIAAVNEVRRRGYGVTAGSGTVPADYKDIAAAVTQDELRDKIRRERSYELCFEGHRKQDLIRWGIYFETIRETSMKLHTWYDNANYAVVNQTIKGKHELLPIPRREVDLMKLYDQNDQW
jgi:hypothetical protein